MLWIINILEIITWNLHLCIHRNTMNLKKQNKKQNKTKKTNISFNLQLDKLNFKREYISDILLNKLFHFKILPRDFHPTCEFVKQSPYLPHGVNGLQWTLANFESCAGKVCLWVYGLTETDMKYGESFFTPKWFPDTTRVERTVNIFMVKAIWMTAWMECYHFFVYKAIGLT